VEQLQQEMVRAKLHHRRAGGVVEPGIGLGDQALEFVIRKESAQIGLHHPKGDLFIGLPRQRRDVVRGHHRHELRHIKPAVAGKAGHHRLAKAKNGSGATGRDVVHRMRLQSVRILIRQRRKSVIPSQTAARRNQVTAYSK